MNRIFKPEDLIDNYDLFLVDVWGVICEGSEIYHDVVESLNWMMKQKSVCFVSNSPRLSEGLAERLSSFGINVSQDMVYTSGEIAVQMLSESDKYFDLKLPSIYYLTCEPFTHIYDSTGLNFTNNISDANIILVSAQLSEGDDLSIYDNILSQAEERKMLCICPNPDTIIPNGKFNTYCPGFIVRNYKGKVIYTGKPYPEIYKNVLSRYKHISKDRILMIGDTIDTDILGASNIGIQSALVSTGNAKLLRKKLNILTQDFASIREHLDIQPSILLSLCKV